MPPIRTMPAIKPVRTERTHEENQERAYIAASRRSDRSLEARVESARRASEIHKKRTGRSLRVREEDVMNEEMYEEEDDDLPMQFRRINALHPGLAYNNPAFSERVNSYLAGQIGVRNYLHQAIYQANQSQYANHFFNPMMQQTGFQNGTMQPQAMNGGAQSPWPINMQNMQQNMQNIHANSHNRSASVASPIGLANQQQTAQKIKTEIPQSMTARRMSVPVQSAQIPVGVTSPTVSQSRSATSSQPSTPHSQTKPTQSPQQASDSYEQSMNSMYPLTTKLPVEAQQLIDGQPGFNVHPFQFNTGVPMPSMGAYSYNPNAKPTKREADSGEHTGLNQTLSPFAFNSHTKYSEPPAVVSPPADFGYNNNFYTDMDFDNDPKYAFNMDSMCNGTHPSTTHDSSGQITPAAGMDATWNPDDFFNYAPADE